MKKIHGNTTHGLTETPEYRIWRAMKTRCFNMNSQDYHLYGGRGITMDSRWTNSFEVFVSDVGPRPTNRHAIERIDNSKGYEPGNVRWATQKEQQRNRRNNRLVTIRGITHCIAEWCERYKVSQQLVSTRLRIGWGPIRAITTPVIKKKCV